MAARVSQDHLFEVALSAIPEALSNGLRAAGLAAGRVSARQF